MARQPRPWWRANRRMFYSTFEGKQYPLGVTDPKDESAAWNALRQLISQLETRSITTQNPREVSTVADAIEAFLRAKSGTVKPVSLKNYARHLAHFGCEFGACPVRTLDGNSVTASAKARGWSDTNLCNYLATVEACLHAAGSPVTFDKPARESAGADSVIPDTVYRACLRESSGDFQQLIRFLWATGCRPSEATRLTVEQLDLSAGTARLRDHKTRSKTKRPRLLYLSPDAVACISEQVSKYQTGPLFRGLRSKPYSTAAIVMRFTRLSAKVGHTITAYQFRHTFATRALKAGIPDTQVAALLGHTNTVMVHRHYNHVGQDARLLRGVVANLEAAAG